MQGSFDQPPIVVRARRGRSLMLLLVSLLFAMAGLGLLNQDGPTAPALLTIGFFALCLLVAIWTLVSPSTLEVGPDGLTQKSLWRRTHWPWESIYDFRPAMLSMTSRTVGFDYVVQRPGLSGLRAFNSAMSGAQATLQPGWAMEPAALADLLNQARERWVTTQPTTATTDDEQVTGPKLMPGFTGARMNGKAFWIACAVVFLLAFALSRTPAGRSGGTLSTVLLIRIYTARLHDLGHSGWWQVPLYVVQVLVLILVMTVGGDQAVEHAVAIAVVLQLIYTAILGALRGDPDANRFGPAPGQPSLVAQAETFR